MQFTTLKKSYNRMYTDDRKVVHRCCWLAQYIVRCKLTTELGRMPIRAESRCSRFWDGTATHRDLALTHSLSSFDRENIRSIFYSQTIRTLTLSLDPFLMASLARNFAMFRRRTSRWLSSASRLILELEASSLRM